VAGKALLLALLALVVVVVVTVQEDEDEEDEDTARQPDTGKTGQTEKGPSNVALVDFLLKKTKQKCLCRL
jgi:hypothetical protein